ncbi:MAG: T9SS type A sorting domain-containing protein [Saprospiraceae bacterium]
MKNNILTLLYLFPLWLSAQNILYVNANVQGGQQDGSSWANATPDLQLGLELAVSGDQIWVAQGVYYPAAGTDRTASFYLKQGVKLYGGFAGGEQNLAERNYTANETILSGNIGNPALANDNSLHVVRGAGLDSTTALDGFTIADGYAYNSLVTEWDVTGGGLLLQASPLVENTCPIIQNCRFVHNSAGSGGAISAKWSFDNLVNPILRNCEFIENRAFVFAGALYKGSPTPDNQPFTLSDCAFKKNYAYGGDGGAVFLTQLNDEAHFVRCVFERDSTPLNGGAICCLGFSQPGGSFALRVDSCSFTENFAGEGAGIHFSEYSLAGVQLDCSVTNSVFTKNWAKGGSGGACFIVGLDEDQINLKMQNVQVLGTFQSASGVIVLESDNLNIEFDKMIAIETFDNSPPWTIPDFLRVYTKVAKINIVNSLFARNSHVINITSPVQSRISTNIANSTFFDNGEFLVKKNWYPEYNWTDTIYNDCYINNCIFWNPEPASVMFYNADLLSPNAASYYDYHIDHSALGIISENVYGPGGMEAFGDHNLFRYDLDTIALFVDTLNNDFRLLPCTPLVNAGNNTVADTFVIVTDLDGLPRIFGGVVDIGAFESQDSCATSTVSFVHPSKQALSIYPNPVGAGATVRISLPGGTRSGTGWRLLDVQGHVLQSGAIAGTGKETEITFSAPLLPGVYIFQAGGDLAGKVVVGR